MIQVVVIIRILHLNMSSFMNNSHDLIKRSQTYTLDRKSISIHSEDRDTSKYKNSNSFEVTLPETLRNVQTMCLAEISLPTNLYTFSNSYQNTKFKFSLNPAEVVDSLSTEYDVLHNYYLNDNYFTAQITSGSYTPQTFASEIQMQMNNEVSDLIKERLHDIPASGSLGFIGNGAINTELTAVTSYINDRGTINEQSYDYQWQISDDLSSGTWSDINGSTNNKYTIPSNTDISSSKKYIRLQLSAVDSNNSTITFYSGYTEIIDEPTTASPSPIISGVVSFLEDATDGTLIAETSNMNVHGVTSPKIEYQWQVAVNEDVSGFVSIEGATHSELDYNRFKEDLKYHNYIRLYVSVEGTTLSTASGYVSIIHSEYIYNNFQVHFDIISQELYIGNNRDDFELNFDIQCEYEDICSSGQQLMWDKSRNWGLPYNMGFDKETYHRHSDGYKKSLTGIRFSNEQDLWLVPDTSDSPVGSFVQSQYFVSPYPINIHWEDTIYMELEKYNSVDELMPYSPVAASLQSDANCVCTYGNAIVKRGSPAANKIYIHPASKMYRPEDGNNCSPVNICSRCKNKIKCPTPYSNVGGIVNSAFAKIPYSLSPTSPSGANFRILAVKGEIQGVSTFAPPLDTISKLKVKFRLHDGRLVDFGNMRYDFTLSVGTLVDEIARSYEVRVPSEYYM